MTADTRFGALPHLDLDPHTGIQVLLADTETPGSNLDDDILAILVQVLVQTAFAGVIDGPQFLGGGSMARCALRFKAP